MEAFFPIRTTVDVFLFFLCLITISCLYWTGQMHNLFSFLKEKTTPTPSAQLDLKTKLFCSTVSHSIKQRRTNKSIFLTDFWNLSGACAAHKGKEVMKTRQHQWNWLISSFFCLTLPPSVPPTAAFASHSSFTSTFSELSHRLHLINKCHISLKFAYSYLLTYPRLCLCVQVTRLLWPPIEQQAIKHEKQHTDNPEYQTSELPCWNAHVWLTLCSW